MKKFFLSFAVILPIFCFLSINQITPGNLFNCALAEGSVSIDVTLSTSPESPVVSDTAVTFTASTTGGSGDYEYKFLFQNICLNNFRYMKSILNYRSPFFNLFNYRML